MAVWPPKLVSVTLYPSLTSTLSSTASTALSSRVRGVGQWKVKEGKKNLFRYLVETEEGDAEEVAALGAHQALSRTPHFLFCREANVWKTAAPPPPTPQTRAEKPRQPITRVAASPGQTVCWQSAGTKPGSTESEGDKGGKSFYHISNGSVCCSRQKETRQRLPARQFPSDWRYSCGGSHALSVRAWTASASHISILMWINAGDNGGSVLHA